MFNSIVPFKAILGTIVIFILFILTFFYLVYAFSINSKGHENWAIITLLLGLGLAVFRCIQNIREIIRLKEEEVSNEDKKVILKTCPEYWVKDTVTFKSNGEEKSITICKNYHNYDFPGNKYHYVGGNIGTFTSNLNTLDYLNSNLTMPDVIDTFAEPPTETNHAHGGTDGNVIQVDAHNTHEPGVTNAHTHPDTNPSTTNDEPEQDFNSNLDYGTYYYHHSDKKNNPSCVVYHKNAGGTTDENLLPHTHFANCKINSGPHDYSADHDPTYITTDIEGNSLKDGNKNVMKWHRHLSGSADSAYSLRYGNYQDNWINKSPDSMEHINVKGGIEINLDRLNQADNVCELSKNFYWTEAYNKCNYNGK